MLAKYGIDHYGVERESPVFVKEYLCVYKSDVLI
jgi:hypothetical protein